MKPSELGLKYDKIAKWWHRYHLNSNYGVKQVSKAFAFTHKGGELLDVGCGAGGRMVNLAIQHDFQVTGIDVSLEMLDIARQIHPEQTFYHANVCDVVLSQRFDFILAWDSLFHLPLSSQKAVLKKLCQSLNKDGIIAYTFGDAHGEHESCWHNDNFYYSSIGIAENVSLLIENGLTPLHLELDQYPEKHVFMVAQKR